ncbi:hypothetical protein CONLIGDRAFT_444350 [Coniochaeta ligniaria NRRL 30616]|uniref:Mediator of RNA polymerase II transcription subunit 18 n=1 Tax=Coniochaeta ligniaria NRRL 30616 TaxID=1408157 RepID=A0A1J7JD96_9PEZI|nr:hypothetical protein CONLIGDRAFT_444350 [Coniochaeta ligniaria NRRL 30616]
MLEYFLTAFVPNDKVDMARGVLQGVCAMAGTHQFKRVLYYRGPDRPDGFKKLKGVERTPNGRFFAELQRYLAKQSFILRVEYPLREQEFGSVAQPEPLDKRHGALRWTDLPDPVLGDVLHIHRKTLTISHQDNLISLVEQNAHTFKAECVEESYIYCLDNVEYGLTRTLHFPGDSAAGSPRGTIPPISDLQPSPFWTLHLKVLVPEATPELSNLAVDLLMSAKRSLGTCFDFKQLDRRVFDTRVQVTPARNAMPQPLGAVVTIGKQV